tara:strand:+ start:24 stop:242 length:219 start_codon:yes stop_codon:yes gene_type:complete
MLQNKEMSEVDQEFFDLTKNFDLEDWRVLRTEKYWYKIDALGVKRPRYKVDKLKLIRYYVNKGVPMPESDYD